MTLHSDEVLGELLDALVDDDPVQLYEHAPCGFLSVDPDGLVVKVNRTLLTMTGYAEDELVGRLRFVDLLSPGGRIYHESHYMPLLHLEGSAREIALDIVCRDGRRLPVLVNAVLERDQRAKPRIIRMAVFDATRRREYERELLLSKARAEESEAQARALAQTLQQTLMPPETPRIPGLELGAVYRPAGDGTEIGGDFYDVFPTGHDWVVTLGDVSGKGAEAAVVTALARYTLRAAAIEHERPAASLDVLNTVLLADASDRYCTVVLLRVRRQGTSFRCELAVAGHPLPLLRRADGTVTEVGEHGAAVGLVEEARSTDVSLALEPGDALVLFTDGVTEARRAGVFYGTSRLTQVVAQGGPAQAIADKVLDDVVGFQGGRTRDDTAVVVLAVPAA